MDEDEQRERIPCPVHRKRLLARCDTGGIWLWCKLCLREHYFTWQQLQQLTVAVGGRVNVEEFQRIMQEKQVPH